MYVVAVNLSRKAVHILHFLLRGGGIELAFCDEVDLLLFPLPFLLLVANPRDTSLLLSLDAALQFSFAPDFEPVIVGVGDDGRQQICSNFLASIPARY